jgi:hypothetical protein
VTTGGQRRKALIAEIAEKNTEHAENASAEIENLPKSQPQPTPGSIRYNDSPFDIQIFQPQYRRQNETAAAVFDR